MATLMCVRCDTGAPRCLSVLTAEKRDFPAQVREDGPCQDSRPKGPFCVYGPALGGVPSIRNLSCCQGQARWPPPPKSLPNRFQTRQAPLLNRGSRGVGGGT